MSPPLRTNQAELCGFHRSSRTWCRHQPVDGGRVRPPLHWVGSMSSRVLPLPQQLLERTINQSAAGDGAACFSGSTAELRISWIYLFNFFLRERERERSWARWVMQWEFCQVSSPDEDCAKGTGLFLHGVFHQEGGGSRGGGAAGGLRGLTRHRSYRQSFSKD